MDIPAYAEIESALRQAGAQSEPAESHGTLSGLIAAAPEVDWQARWLKVTLDAGNDDAAPALPASARPRLEALFDGTRAAMSDLQMRFEPLLPADDAPIAERARCLGLWCQGFLYGFSMARPGGHEKLPPQVREVLDDLGRLAQVEPPEGEGGEQDEAALMEIVEYMRVAAQLVHDELRLSEPVPGSQTHH